jgi:peptide deformylase
MTTEILTWPHPMLTRPAARVADDVITSDEFYGRCSQLASAMMRVRGLGLAAVQIGWDAAVFVLCQDQEIAPGDLRQGAGVYVNPSIIVEHAGVVEDEGCLSFPGVTEKLHAPGQLVLSFTTLNGDTDRQHLVGWKARAAYHETHHLAGKTMLDRMGVLQRKLFLKRYAKAKARRSS